MRTHPEYVGGTRRDVTALIRAVPGLVAKDGAAAVYAVGLADGRGVAVKVADGNLRVKSVVLAAVLRRLDVGSEADLVSLGARARARPRRTGRSDGRGGSLTCGRSSNG